MIIKRFFFRFLAPAADGDAGGGTVDRGDFLVSSAPENDEPDADLSEDPAVAELEAELKPDADEDGAAVDDKPKVKDSRIPAARHKEILEKERAKTAALAAEVAQLKQRRAMEDGAADASVELTSMEAEVARMEVEYAELLSDGETKQAVAVMAKIRAAERQMAEVKSDLKIQAAAAQAAESSRYQTALNRIESAYPVLNPDHDDYDATTEARVVRLSRANQVDGMTPVAALQDAVEAVLGVVTGAQERATSVTPRAPKDIAAERKAAAVAKTVKAVTGTPPSAAGLGLPSDSLGGGKLDAAAAIKLSQAAFARLSEADLASMRGDSL